MMRHFLVAMCLCFLTQTPTVVAQEADGAIRDPAPPPATYIVLFDSGSADVTDAAKLVLEQVVLDQAVNKDAVVMVKGHYDRSNTDEYADQISQQMADNVRAYLIAKGVPSASIKVDWRGAREPLVATPNGVAEAANRRVDIWFEPPQN